MFSDAHVAGKHELNCFFAAAAAKLCEALTGRVPNGTRPVFFLE